MGAVCGPSGAVQELKLRGRRCQVSGAESCGICDVSSKITPVHFIHGPGFSFNYYAQTPGSLSEKGVCVCM